MDEGEEGQGDMEREQLLLCGALSSLSLIKEVCDSTVDTLVDSRLVQRVSKKQEFSN